MTTDEGIVYDRSLLGKENEIGTFEVSLKMITEFAKSTGETYPKYLGNDANIPVVAPPTICNLFVGGSRPDIKLEFGEVSFFAGQSIESKADIKPGNSMPFTGLPIGTIIHNIELKTGKGAQLARSAGVYAQFVGRDRGYAQIKLSSGELRIIRQECRATVGAVSNPDNSNQNLGKAGRNRHKGIRPSVRGVVMNPIDHPHGGGEGRTSGGRHPVTPWGKPTKGAKTRNNKKTDKYILRTRNAKKGR